MDIQSAAQLPSRDPGQAPRTRCWDCGHEASPAALICPNCSANQNLPTRAVTIVAAIFGIVAVATIATLLFDDTDPAANAFQAPQPRASHDR
jgi:hypothetical protein